jgi:hypothetical protein
MTRARRAALLALLAAVVACGRAGPPVRIVRGQPVAAVPAAAPQCEDEPRTADGEEEERPK